MSAFELIWFLTPCPLNGLPADGHVTKRQRCKLSNYKMVERQDVDATKSQMTKCQTTQKSNQKSKVVGKKGITRISLHIISMPDCMMTKAYVSRCDIWILVGNCCSATSLVGTFPIKDNFKMSDHLHFQ